MNPTPLSGRQDIREQLDAVPVLDYLIQHGVVNKEQALNIKNETNRKTQNVALVKLIEESGTQGSRLLVNALRQAGQHKLANSLDEGVRITPSKHAGYLERTRHKGQLGLQIRVRAICVPALKSSISSTTTTDTEWIVTEEKRPANSLPRPSALNRQSMLFLEVIEPRIVEDEDTRGCCWFCCGKSKKKPQHEMVVVRRCSDPAKTSELVINSLLKDIKNNEDHNENMQTDEQKKGNGQTPCPKKEAKSRQAIFKEKTAKFYEILGNSKSAAHTRLLKYFEQERGILVLSTMQQKSGVIVLTICTQMAHLNQIRDDYCSSDLNTKIEDRIVTGEIIKQTEVLGLQLEIFLDMQELDIVEQELCSS